MNNKTLTIPNIISIIRIVMIFIFVPLYFNKDTRTASLVLIIITGLADLLDGYIARKFDQISELGKLLDPVADKLFQFTMIVCFYFNNIIGLWLVIFFFSKEAVMTIGGFIFVRSTKLVIPAKWYGKLASSLFFVSIITAFFVGEIGTVSNNILTGMFIVAAIISLFSTIQYIISAVKIKKENNANKEKII